MDLLIIPVCLLIGGGLIYLGVQGMPNLSLSQLPVRADLMPFSLMEWLKARTAEPARPRERAARDAELVELMNELIFVREELSGLELGHGINRSAPPHYRFTGRNPQASG